MTGNGAEENETYKEAVTWFKKAASKNFVQAMYALGLAYRDGDGVKKDITEAKKWFTKAAAKGDEKATQALEKL